MADQTQTQIVRIEYQTKGDEAALRAVTNYTNAMTRAARQQALMDGSLAKASAQYRDSMRSLEGASKASNDNATATGRSGNSARLAAFQFEQMSSSIAAGTSPLRAITIQLGDMAGVLGSTFNTTSAFGRFMAGPWPIMIAAGAMALIPLITKLFETEEAAKATAEEIDAMINKALGSIDLMSQARTAAAKLIEAENRQADAIEARRHATRGTIGQLRRDEAAAERDRRAAYEGFQEIIRRVKAEQDAQAEATRQTGAAAASATRELSALEQMFRSTVEAAQTATQEFELQEQTLKRLDAAYAKGAISYAVYRSAVESIRADRGIDRAGRPQVTSLPTEGMEIARVNLGELQRQLEEVAAAFDLMSVSASQMDETLQNLAVQSIGAIGDELSAAIDGTQSFADAFEQMGRQIIAMTTKLAVEFAIFQIFSAALGGSNPLVGAIQKAFGFAKGAALDQGNVIPFARGGVVTEPTVFPMAKGMGLMGEAGPEAIMPLRRNGRGELGVGAAQGDIIVNNYSSAKVDVSRSGDNVIINIAAERARMLIAADIARGDGSVSRAMQRVYGMDRSGR